MQQAAGRVIRTDTDKGVIMLLDDRFLLRQYQESFPREWADFKRCSLLSARRRSDEILGMKSDGRTLTLH